MSIQNLRTLEKTLKWREINLIFETISSKSVRIVKDKQSITKIIVKIVVIFDGQKEQSFRNQ